MHYFTPTDSLHDLKQQYRHLARTHHPDNGGSSEEMAAVNAEYAMLLVELEQLNLAPPPPQFPPQQQPPPQQTPPEEQPPTRPRKPRPVIPTKEESERITPKSQRFYWQEEKQPSKPVVERIASGIQTIGKVGSLLYEQFKPEIHTAVRKTADKFGERLGEKLGEKFGETLGDSIAERISEGITTLFPDHNKPDEPHT